MSWQKGGPSPNPGGRPKTARYAAAARELLSSPARETPGEWGPEEGWTRAQKAAYADYGAWTAGDSQAATRVLERAEGKVPASLELDATLGMRLPEGVTPEMAAAVKQNPTLTLAQLMAADIGSAERFPDRVHDSVILRLLAVPVIRESLRVLLARAEEGSGALLTTTVPELTDG